MRVPAILSLLLGVSAASATNPAQIVTPEDAVHALETAYAQKDVESAVAAKDFLAEARFMLQKMSPELAADAEVLKQTAEVLEQSYRQDIRTNGFPDFAALRCTFTRNQQLSTDLVQLTEECIFPDGKASTQDLHVFKGEQGWRVVTLPD